MLVVEHTLEDLDWLRPLLDAGWDVTVSDKLKSEAAKLSHDVSAGKWGPRAAAGALQSVLEENWGGGVLPIARFIVDNYDVLPDVAVFLQGDPSSHVRAAKLQGMLACVNPDWRGYLSVNELFIRGRHVGEEYDSFLGALAESWEAHDESDGPVLPRTLSGRAISFTCCAQFMATRGTMRRHPAAWWRLLIDTTLTVRTAPYEYISAFTGTGEAAAKWAGGAMEHSWSVVFGESFDAQRKPLDAYCGARGAFLDAGVCPGSPCTGGTTVDTFTWAVDDILPLSVEAREKQQRRRAKIILSRTVAPPATGWRPSIDAGAGAGAGAPPPPPTSAGGFVSRGVYVAFPFQPYDAQLAFINKALEALQCAKNALLESPTGTGKAYVAAQQQLGLLQHAEVRGVPVPSGAAVDAVLAAAGVIKTPADFSAPAAAAAAAALGGPVRIGGSVYQYADGAGAGGGAGAGRPALSLGSGGSAVGIGALGGALGPPKIIYASRTHSQLSQVVKELKRCGYTPTIAVLGSREQLCVNPAVMKLEGSAQNHACRAKTKTRTCGANNSLNDWISQGGKLSQLGGGGGSDAGGCSTPLLDIEELRAMGKARNLCTYFLPRDPVTQKDADVLFVPYAYVIDPIVRAQALGSIDWRNAIVIFDEAHNLEEACSEAASFDLTCGELSRAIDELRRVLEPLLSQANQKAAAAGSAAQQRRREAAGGAGGEEEEEAPPFSIVDATNLFNILVSMEKAINAPAPGGNADALRVETGAQIFQLFNQWNVHWGTKPLVTQLLDSVTQWLHTRDAVLGSARRGYALEGIRTFLDRIFRSQERAVDESQHFRVIYHRPPSSQQQGRGGGGGITLAPSRAVGRTLSYWCFSPSVIFRELSELGVRSLLLASGTLSPLNSYAAELRVPFPVRLENPHIVSKDQIFAAVLTKGVTGKTLNSSYEHRDKPEYLKELGLTIANVVRIIPDGVLIFFPSYAMLTTALDFWKSDKEGVIWTRLTAQKECFVEPRSGGELKDVIASFNRAIDERSRGAVLFAVCRGKVSEGIDFADSKGRAVIVTGLPYAPLLDPRIMLKKAFLDDALKASKSGGGGGGGGLSGQQWYQLQALRAVNQALGRVIRHSKDYGAILLLDERFSNDVKSLSAWIRPYCNIVNEPGQLIASLAAFFRHASKGAPSGGGGGMGGPAAAAAAAVVAQQQQSWEEAGVVVKGSVGGGGVAPVPTAAPVAVLVKGGEVPSSSAVPARQGSAGGGGALAPLRPAPAGGGEGGGGAASGAGGGGLSLLSALNSVTSGAPTATAAEPKRLTAPLLGAGATGPVARVAPLSVATRAPLSFGLSAPPPTRANSVPPSSGAAGKGAVDSALPSAVEPSMSLAAARAEWMSGLSSYLPPESYASFKREFQAYAAAMQQPLPSDSVSRTSHHSALLEPFLGRLIAHLTAASGGDVSNAPHALKVGVIRILPHALQGIAGELLQRMLGAGQAGGGAGGGQGALKRARPSE